MMPAPMMTTSAVSVIACPAAPRGTETLRQDAEALRLDPQRHVELRAEVLERDRRRQLHHLRLAEVRSEPRPQLLADLLAGDGHALGVLERGALHLREEPALAPSRHLADLVLAGPRLHPTRCVDVDSEGTAVDERDPEVDERQQGGRELPGLLD